MRTLSRLALCAITLSLAACATLLQAPASAPPPWVPAHDLPEPGEGPLYPQN
jgi:hypothetical protein